MRPADVLSQVSTFLPPSLANKFWSGWQYLKACKYVKRWCEPGSNTTQCLRGPTKAQWYTDKHGTFSTQTKAIFSSTTLLFHSCSHGSQSKNLKVGALPIYWSTFILSYLSPIQLPEMPDKIHSILQSKPHALHGHWPSIHARHDKACPCNNSLLTLLFQMVRVSLAGQSFFFWEWLHHKDIREGFQGFFFSKAGNSNFPKSSTEDIIHGGEFWYGSDRIQKRNLKWISKSPVYLPKCGFSSSTSPKRSNKTNIKKINQSLSKWIKPYFGPFSRNYSSSGDT